MAAFQCYACILRLAAEVHYVKSVLGVFAFFIYYTLSRITGISQLQSVLQLAFAGVLFCETEVCQSTGSLKRLNDVG